MRDHPRGIVDKGDQVGLALDPFADHHARPMHDVAHPQLARVGEGEAAPVMITAIAGGLVHQPMAGQQSMHGRGRQRQFVGHLGQCACFADDQLHGERGIALLDPQQRLGHRRRQLAHLAAIGARFRQQRIEAALAVRLQPVAHGLLGHPRAAAEGDGVVLRGFLCQSHIQPLALLGPVRKVGDHPVAKQGNVVAAVIISVGHGRDSAWRRSICLPARPYAGLPGGSAPTQCWRALERPPPGWRRGTNPSGFGKFARNASAIPRNATSTSATPRRSPNAVNVGAQPAKTSGSRPLIRAKALCTPCTRRALQRNAPGKSMSRRTTPQAASRLGACSNASTTASTSAKVPLSRAAKQSGSRLKVRWPSGQYQRAIKVPGGETRA